MTITVTHITQILLILVSRTVRFGMLRSTFRGPGALARPYSACLVRLKAERLCTVSLRGEELRQMAARSVSWVKRTSLAAAVASGMMRSRQPYSVGCFGQITLR
jgi:hypothetical protein